LPLAALLAVAATSPTFAESTNLPPNAEINAQSPVETPSSIAPLVFFDAKTPLDALTPQGVELRRLDSGAVETSNGLDDSWPGFHFLGDWNLGDYSALEATVSNPGNEPIQLYCRLDCAAVQFPEGSTTAGAEIAPGETKVWRIELPGALHPETRAKLFAMRGKPGGIKTDAYSVDAKIPFDKQTLVAIRFFENQNGRGDRWTLKSLVAVPTPAEKREAFLSWAPEKFFPMIDKFGQFKHKDWPGKTRSLNDLRAQIAKEDAELAANQPSDRNEFGGWTKGPQLEATGSFRTEKIDGVWRLVDPKGRLFWSNGVDCVGHWNGVTPTTDREFYFDADVQLQRNGGPFDAFINRDANAVNNYYAGRGEFWSYNFTASNLYLKFGADWQKKADDLAHRRLRSWGLNTIGNWSAESIERAQQTPYVATVGIGSPKIEGSSGYWGKFADPFHPEFKASLRRSLDGNFLRFAAEDPFCVGFFVDNEISWGDAGSLARAALASPSTQPAKLAFIDWLRAKYGADVAALNAAWGTTFADWDALAAEPFEAPKADAAEPTAQTVAADCNAFYTVISEKYFSEILATLREKAPKKLYLGCRFAWTNPLAIAAAQKYCDVVSYNFYQAEVGSFRPVEGVDKPCIVGEFHFGALDRGLFHTGLGPTESQEARAAAYENYVRSALLNPWIVGVHWFQYGDQATTGRFDGENYQIGLVDICDVPYAETIEAVRRVGYAMYDIRAEAKSTDETLRADREEAKKNGLTGMTLEEINEEIRAARRGE
jgi:hypothetical protein